MIAPRVPNLFVVGAPKCGTTALSHYLAAHPAIYMSEQSGVKEPGYFAEDIDKIFGRRPVTSKDSYLALFDPAPPRARYLGEASVCYLASESAVPRILRFSPQALFVVMVRNPVEIALGMHAQRVRERTENLIDFESAWRSQRQRLGSTSLPDAFRDPRALQYGELAKIGSQVERLFGAVPKARVHVIVHDDFRRDPEQSFGNLLQFMGLEYGGPGAFPLINESRHYRAAGLQQFLLNLEGLRERARIPGGWGVQKLIDRYNIRSGPSPLGAELSGELRRYFRPEVALLSGLLGRDFMDWIE